MNINIQNNSDPSAATGSLYPYVLFMPPSLQSRAMDNNQNSIFDTYTVELLITDTYGYEQAQLGYKTDTTIEIENKLQALAKRFVQYLLDYSAVSYPLFNVSDYSIEFDPYRFTANTRSIRMRLTLTVPAVCDDASLDISFLPENIADIGTNDYESQQPVASYCPLGFTVETDISTEYNKLITWVIGADASNFALEIAAHPDYVGNITLVSHEVTDIAGNLLGAQVQTGYGLSVVEIPTTEAEVYYTLVISADFNGLQGVHTIEHTLNVTITQPIENDPAVFYNSNNYICNDLSASLGD